MPTSTGQKFYYVYILESVHAPAHYYTGFTENLESRLTAHNDGRCSHTKKFKPWEIKTTIVFTDRVKALAFEKYLKTSSGRSFTKKQL